MSVYKVPQDVEAEDKLLGPFTFRQFIFLIIAAFSAFMMFQLGRLNLTLIIFPLPFFLFFGFLGVYRRKDQPTELYLLAVIRYYFKPRRRIWDQDGMLELVKITAPKKIEKHLGKGLTNDQVESRLNQLSMLMDTRGWSVKNATVQDNSGNQSYTQQESDRLVAPAQLQPVSFDVHENDDIMNPYNQTSQNYDQMMQNATNSIKEDAKTRMRIIIDQNAAAATAPTTPAPATTTTPPTQASAAATPVQPAAITPAAVSATPAEPAVDPSTSVMTTPVNPDIIKLAENDDVSVSTLAKQAERVFQDEETISLH